MIWLMFLLAELRVLSSAELQLWELFPDKSKSLIKMLKNNGPNIEPSETPVMISLVPIGKIINEIEFPLKP